MSTAKALTPHVSPATAPRPSASWQRVCSRQDLVPHSGVAAWLETDEGPVQVALFYLPGGANPPQSAAQNPPSLAGHAQELYAIDHRDPFSGANVIARGIVGVPVGQVVPRVTTDQNAS